MAQVFVVFCFMDCSPPKLALGNGGIFLKLWGNMDLSEIIPKLKDLSLAEQQELMALIDRLEQAKGREAAQKSFMAFVKHCWPGFVEGPHHKIMAEAFERVVFGDCKRLIINMAPRHTKSEFASFLLPAWFMGNFPDKKIIQATHTAELAVDFGRKVRPRHIGRKWKPPRSSKGEFACLP